MCLILEG